MSDDPVNYVVPPDAGLAAVSDAILVGGSPLAAPVDRSGGGTLSNLYEMACCGLTAAEQLLIDHGIPLPDTRQVIYHQPTLTCGCDSLFVTVKDESAYLEPSQFNEPSTIWDDCMPRRTIDFEVHLYRCVHVPNPLEDGAPDCAEDGDCRSVLPCPDELPPARPESPCDPAPDKATETLWLLEERWLLSTYLAKNWSICMCQGLCQSDGCGSALGCRKIRYVGARGHDSGGCGGTVFTYQILWP